MKTNFRTKVFKRAYEIMKTTGKTFEVSLSKAWQVYRLLKKMRKGITAFAFEKADGTLRRAKGIIKAYTPKTTNQRKENFKTVAYFDTDKQSFRSFKVENLITVF